MIAVVARPRDSRSREKSRRRSREKVATYLNDALIAPLEQEAARKAEVVKLRYFAGLSAAETASALGVSLPTVERDWRFARALLRAELSEGDALR